VLTALSDTLLPPYFPSLTFARSFPDVINVSGHRLSTAEIESALIVHAGVSETAVIGTADELTGQAVYAFVSMKPEFDFSAHSEPELLKELTLQVRKVIGPFAGTSPSSVSAFVATAQKPFILTSDLRRLYRSSQGHLPGVRPAQDAVWQDPPPPSGEFVTPSLPRSMSH
jgi:acyl-CoA synthetase (AMP-forming)/AMP-acid ligase II